MVTRKKFISRLILFMGLFILFIGVSGQTIFAQIGDEQFFPETGHWVTGEFLSAYHSVDHPGFVYGNPITRPFEDSATHRIVQYFERARFELYPYEIPGRRIQRTPLGDFLYSPGAKVNINYKSSGCQFFPETGYYVCFAFLDFFNQNGKVAQFGYPISDFEFHDGRITQYFQLARLDWYPENPPQQRVVIADLGIKYFNETDQDIRHREPEYTTNTIQTITQIQTLAFPAVPVMPNQDEQTIYVTVKDQTRQPVEDAEVEISVILPSGKELHSAGVLETDSNGIVRFTFPVYTPLKGQAIVNVIARLGKMEDAATTSFRVWW